MSLRETLAGVQSLMLWDIDGIQFQFWFHVILSFPDTRNQLTAPPHLHVVDICLFLLLFIWHLNFKKNLFYFWLCWDFVTVQVFL